MDMRKWWIWIVISITALALLAAVLWVALRPEVLFVYPPEGERISPVDGVQIEFSRNMNTDSVEASLQVEPATPVAYEWQENSLTILPELRWQAGEEIEVFLSGDARSRLGLSVKERSWSYSVEGALVVYLWPNNEPANLYALDLESGETRQLTQFPEGLNDYSVHPEGLGIYYCRASEPGSGQVGYWDRKTGSTQPVVNLQQPCTHLEISPGGTQLAYGSIPGGGVSLLPLIDGGRISRVPVAKVFDFTWRTEESLSLLSTVDDMLWLYATGSQRLISIPSISENIGNWSPDGDTYITNELIDISTDFVPAGVASHLVTYSIGDQVWTDLTPEPALEDHEPVFSPGGETIAFTRKSLEEDEWTLGRQIWRMRADGSAAQQLTDLPDIIHNNLNFSPDGDILIFLRFDQQSITDPPELWMMELDDREQTRLVIGAYRPGWLP